MMAVRSTGLSHDLVKNTFEQVHSMETVKEIEAVEDLAVVLEKGIIQGHLYYVDDTFVSITAMKDCLYEMKLLWMGLVLSWMPSIKSTLASMRESPD